MYNSYMTTIPTDGNTTASAAVCLAFEFSWSSGSRSLLVACGVLASEDDGSALAGTGITKARVKMKGVTYPGTFARRLSKVKVSFENFHIHI